MRRKEANPIEVGIPLLPGDPLPRICVACKQFFSPNSPSQKYCLNPCKAVYIRPRHSERKKVAKQLSWPITCSKCGEEFVRRIRRQHRCPRCASRNPAYKAPVAIERAIAMAALYDDSLDLMDVRTADLNRIVIPLPIAPPDERTIVAALEAMDDNDPRIPQLHRILRSIWIAQRNARS